MRFLLGTSLLLLLGSCSKNAIDSETVCLAPAENIQYLFERSDIEALTTSFIKEKRGNVILLSNTRNAVNFLNDHDLLVDPTLFFVWDTLTVNKKLFVVDQSKRFPLHPLEISDTTNSSLVQKKLVLDMITQSRLSSFFVSNIGRELLLIDKNGFVAGASQLSKSSDDNLLVQLSK